MNETTAQSEETQATLPAETTPDSTAAAAKDASVLSGCRGLTAQVPLFSETEEPLSAQSAMLYEVNSGTVVYAYHPDERIAPASLVKIMTLLLAVEEGNLGQMVTVTKSALSSLPSGAMTVGLQAGEKLTLEQLLHCMMVGSGNDAAAVIAEHLYGSQGKFAARMNQRAGELGCTNTNFMNAHGLHDENQYTTARDMCGILSAAMENGTFMVFFGTTEYTVPATNMSAERHLKTTNFLMAPKNALYDARVTGGRTGINHVQGRCLAASAAEGNMKYAIVVLGAAPEYRESDGSVIRYGNYEDAKVLLNMGFDGMKVTQVLSKHQILDQYPVTNARNHVAVGAADTVTVAIPADVSLSDLTFKYGSAFESLTAPIALGQKVSELQLWLGSTCVAQTELVARNAVPVASDILVDTWTETPDGPDLLMMAMVILVVAAVFILAAGVLYLVRRVQISMMKAHSRRRRRDRRRSR